MKIQKLVSGSFIFLILSGCAGVGEKMPFFPKENAKINSNATDLVRNVGQVDQVSDRGSSVKVESGAWVSSTPIKIHTLQKLPSIFYEEVTFNRQIVSLHELSARLTEMTKVRVVSRTDAVRVASQAIRDGVAPLPGLTALNGAPAVSANAPQGAEMQSQKTLRVLYQGTLKGLLDTVAARLGVSWAYDGLNVQFFVTDTKTFVLNAPTGDITITTGMQTNSNSTGGNTGGGATSGVNSNSQLTLWADVEKNIKTYLSPLGSVNHSKATGTFSVTDIPDVLDRVESYIQTLNKELARQIVLEVNVYAVSLTRDDTQGLDLNSIFTNGKNKLQLTPVVGGGSSIAISRTEKEGETTTLLIEALSKAGATRKVTTASLVAANNHPVPLQVGTQFSFISSQQTTNVPNVGVQTTSTVSQLNTGLALMLMPRIVDTNNILLQFNIGMSSLKNLRVYSSTNSRIEMPELETRNVLQRVNLRSGETLIVSGFEDGTDRQGGAGVFTSNNPFWGQQTQSGAREVFVITVKPSELAGRY